MMLLHHAPRRLLLRRLRLLHHAPRRLLLLLLSVCNLL
jgi:hypothetical protein